MSSINTNIHFDNKHVPQAEIVSYPDTQPPFHVFKINTNGNEINYFFLQDEQLKQFLNHLTSVSVNKIAELNGTLEHVNGEI